MNISQALYSSMMYLSCIFELYLLYDLLTGGFEIYEERKYIYYLYLLGGGTVIFVINNLNQPLVNLLSVPIVFLIFAWLVFRMKIKYNIFYVLFYTVILDVIEFALYYIYILLSKGNKNADINNIIFTIVKLIVMFVIVQTVKRQHQRLYENGNYKYSKSLYILPIASLVLLNGFVMAEEHSAGYILTCIGGILLVISNVNSFSTMERFLKAESLAKDTELLSLKAKLELSHFKRMEEMNQSYAEYLHEMKRIDRMVEHLIHIKPEIIMDGLLEKISQVERPSGDQYLNTNPIAKAIFVEYEKQSFDKGINYCVDIQPGLDIGFIDDLDIVSIFGNLLDNALEAAEGCDEGYINVSLYKGNEKLVIIKVENNFKITPQKNGKKYLTIKSDKDKHGFGIKKIEEIAEKYGGILNCSEEKNIFRAVLILSELPN